MGSRKTAILFKLGNPFNRTWSRWLTTFQTVQSGMMDCCLPFWTVSSNRNGIRKTIAKGAGHWS